MKALREAIINALIHRDYSKYREGSYVYVQIYDDRIQIISPGSLYGGIKPSDLGTEKMLAEELKLSRPAIALNIKELKDADYIEREGSDRKGYWKILK